MQQHQQALISFFELIAKKDTLAMGKLAGEKSFTVTDDHWHFTLPDLHTFLSKHDDTFNAIEYSKFRKLLYSSPVNQAVKSYNAELVITDNRNNVNKSTYSLVWHDHK